MKIVYLQAKLKLTRFQIQNTVIYQHEPPVNILWQKHTVCYETVNIVW